MQQPLMRAEWKDLLIASYATSPALLEPLVPHGLELHRWKGDAFVSLVAFDFRRVRLRGIAVPGHREFPEWNLRFYVRERAGDRRVGVVFIREFVPKRLVSLGARFLYNEPYRTFPMTSRVETSGAGVRLTHTLRRKDGADSIEAGVSLETVTPPEGSEPHFFKEHSWGFGTTRAGRTLVYRVRHPVWGTREIRSLDIRVDGAALYGDRWGFIGEREPDSAVFAVGSAIEVYPGVPL